ncbi:hypothetical protein [Neobacillus massiliamazoniensis]|uniref:Uncharacterized protein n=1 Tax=Neobacillus massiliamazoniensis TaxID=1499688 RepID=A0A0U1P2S1_9BACI|nr:hypothetical protein [Neobacillus massiliamazoniensis]CRK84531.1 hypothetical protein BN000_04563 [Neobacillus massiliamazoniensis]
MDPRKIFLIELHEIIKNSSEEIRNHLVSPSEDNIVWDEFKLSEEEVAALKKCKFDDVALSAIEKTVRDTILGAFHDAFSLLDAVTDPEVVELYDTWLGLTLSEPNEEEEENEGFLHDEVYDAYWDWSEQRNKDED